MRFSGTTVEGPRLFKDEWMFVRLYTIFMDEVNFIPTDANGQLTYRPIQNTKGIYLRLVRQGDIRPSDLLRHTSFDDFVQQLRDERLK